MRAAPPGSIGPDVRRELTREALQGLMQEIARVAPSGSSYRVFLVGGGTAVFAGWRSSTIDANLHADHEAVFRDIQGIKERLQVNVEFVRPEDFVPPLSGTEDRHILLETIGRVSFYHYDPYAQLLSKVVRGFRKDMQDGESFIPLVMKLSPSCMSLRMARASSPAGWSTRANFDRWYSTSPGRHTRAIPLSHNKRSSMPSTDSWTRSTVTAQAGLRRPRSGPVGRAEKQREHWIEG